LINFFIIAITAKTSNVIRMISKIKFIFKFPLIIIFPTVADKAKDVTIVVGIDFFIKPAAIERMLRAPTVKAVNKIVCKLFNKLNRVNVSLTIGLMN